MIVVADVKLTVNTDLFKAASDKQIAAGLEAVGQKAEGYVKPLVTVRTGRLRNSIIHFLESKYTEVVGTNVDYSIYVEFGTTKMRARPYLRPGVLNHTDEYSKILERHLRKG